VKFFGIPRIRSHSCPPRLNQHVCILKDANTWWRILLPTLPNLFPPIWLPYLFSSVLFLSWGLSRTAHSGVDGAHGITLTQVAHRCKSLRTPRALSGMGQFGACLERSNSLSRMERSGLLTRGSGWICLRRSQVVCLEWSKLVCLKWSELVCLKQSGLVYIWNGARLVCLKWSDFVCLKQSGLVYI
jgi:hypothetical protein